MFFFLFLTSNILLHRPPNFDVVKVCEKRFIFENKLGTVKRRMENVIFSERMTSQSK